MQKRSKRQECILLRVLRTLYVHIRCNEGECGCSVMMASHYAVLWCLPQYHRFSDALGFFDVACDRDGRSTDLNWPQGFGERITIAANLLGHLG